jgi:hypothetical protein
VSGHAWLGEVIQAHDVNNHSVCMPHAAFRGAPCCGWLTVHGMLFNALFDPL